MKIFAETERLLLREILPSDEKGMFDMDADPDVHTYLGKKPLKTIEEARQTIASIRNQYIQHGIGRWAVIEKETGCFVGWCGLKFITELTCSRLHYYDIGYRFLRKYWGRGFASESAKAVLAYGFQTLSLETIYAIADANNVSSIKVLEKLGLRFVEVFEHQGVPHHWFEIPKHAFAKPNE